MPYSVTTYSESYGDRLVGARHPVFVARNCLREASTNDVRWTAGGAYGTNLAELLFPVKNLWDNKPWTPSQSDTDSSGRYDVIAPMNSSFDSFDSVFYVFTEPPFRRATCTFRVSVANDSGGSPGTWDEIHSENVIPGEMRKTVWLSDGSDFATWNNVDWLRLSFVGFNAPPKIGQMVVGLRTLMNVQPNRPYDPLAAFSSMDVLEGVLGSRHRYVDEKAFFQSGMTFTAGPIVREQLRGVWNGSDQGENLVLVQDSGQSRLCWIQNTPSFDYVSPYVSQPTFVLQEVPPYEASDG